MRGNRFSDDDVRAICRDRRPSTVVARERGVSAALVRHIRLGMIYRHVERPAKMPEWRSGGPGGNAMYGESNPSHVLTEAAVRWLREQARRPNRPPYRVLAVEVARRFRLLRRPSERAVRNAVCRVTWRRVGSSS